MVFRDEFAKRVKMLRSSEQARKVLSIPAEEHSWTSGRFV